VRTTAVCVRWRWCGGGERREVVVGDGGVEGDNEVSCGGLGVGVGEQALRTELRSMWNHAKERTKTKHPAVVQAHL